jgi:polygalacturonase
MHSRFLALAFLLPTLYVASGKTLDATKAGIVADGATLNTAAIQQAINNCSADGGGMIEFPAGQYVTGTIQLKDNVTLYLDKNAVLLGSTNAADYRNLDPFISGVGSEMGYGLVVSVGAKNVGLEGAGTIDGRGKAVKAMQTEYTIRPFLVRWINCADITVKDVHLVNSGAWTMNFFQCTNVVVSGVTIRSLDLANNDGIDSDSCEKVRIKNCDIDSGDDAICFKATGTRACRDIIVTGCKLKTRCNAVKCGTESLGDFENIRVSDCQIRDTLMNGIALFSVDGSHLHDVTFSDITMDGVTVPINLRLGARLKTFRQGDQPRPPGILRDVIIENIRVTGAKQIGLLMNGIPGHFIENITLKNIRIELAGGGTLDDAAIQLPEKEKAYPEYNTFGKVMPAYGIYARHVQGITFDNVQTTVKTPDSRPEKIFIDAENVTH